MLANDVDQFITALIDADIGTGIWKVTFSPVGGPMLDFDHRVGGCAHKVIRWAFEAQGMYAAPGEITNGPGLPPRVDIYIQDRRPTSDNTRYGMIEYGPGSYAPVSLHWDRDQVGSDDPPKWQADETAIEIDDDEVYVTVGNRGSQSAANVEVSVWWIEWPSHTDAPEWEGGTGWELCDARPAQDIAPKDTKEFGPFTTGVTAGQRYLVLARATCADDPANTDTATFLPCSQQRTLLVDLVANDNNLGLRVLEAP